MSETTKETPREYWEEYEQRKATLGPLDCEDYEREIDLILIDLDRKYGVA